MMSRGSATATPTSTSPTRWVLGPCSWGLCSWGGSSGEGHRPALQLLLLMGASHYLCLLPAALHVPALSSSTLSQAGGRHRRHPRGRARQPDGGAGAGVGGRAAARGRAQVGGGSGEGCVCAAWHPAAAAAAVLLSLLAFADCCHRCCWLPGANARLARATHLDLRRYPGRKDENWWLVVGDTGANALLAIKRVTLQVGAARMTLQQRGIAARPREGCMQ